MTQPHCPAAAEQLAERLAAPAVRSTTWTLRIATGMFLVLFALAAFAPISSGTVAVGALAPSESRQTLQHPTGGIIAEILVSEGETVQAGELLVRLEGVEEGAAAGVVGVEIAALTAEVATREAEIAGRGRPDFPAALLSQAERDPEIAAIVTAQAAAFDSRTAQTRVLLAQVDARASQVGEQMASAQARIDSAVTQIGLVEQEAEGLRMLYERGLAPLPRVLALERAGAELRGQEAALRAEISRLRAERAELAARRRQIRVDATAAAAEALRSAHAELAAASNRQRAAGAALARTEVTAPMSGEVINLAANTVGGVVRPGEPILEIVPATDQLVVRARIRPQDGDDVRAGQAARIRFDLLGQAAAPRVSGTIASISADALEDPRTGLTYFEARVEIPPSEAARLPKNAFAPGLPAEVLIETGSATVLSYLFAPIDQFTFRALREP